jgi:hypothetical protein
MGSNYNPVVDSNPFSDTLLGLTSEIINQPYSSMNLPLMDTVQEELKGGAKSKKTKKSSAKKDKKDKKVRKEKKVKKVSKEKKPKKAPSEKKRVKEIDTFKKPKLERIAKKHEVSLKARDGKVKTKEQLFRSLKRKNLI